MLIDTHCHLSTKDYCDVKAVIKNMGNNIMIVSGADMFSNKEVIELVNTYDNIYGTIGIHPSEVAEYNKETMKWLEDNLSNPKIVGIGEIGLDYHYDGYDKELQKEVFVEQIKLAKKYNKPVVIHSRDATIDTLEVIGKYLINYPTVMHCYSGSLETAKELIKMGVMLGIGGVVTFKNAKKLVDVVREIPLKYLLLETDSPYLAPVPHRGKLNEPKYVELVAEKVAEIKSITKEEVIENTMSNAIRIFDLKI